MKRWHYALLAIALIAVLFGALYVLRPHPGGEPAGIFAAVEWQRMASPGALSQGHEFLEHDCAACHMAVRGPTADRCIACHANNESLLSAQPTAFHSNIGECRGCHREHGGSAHRPVLMDHVRLARIGRSRAQAASGFAGVLASSLPVAHSRIRPEETLLDCGACHSNQDPHRSLFGADCGSCHGTAAWTIPEFRHPSAMSTDCAQCHQAPPSHYMMHFEMVSMKIAGVHHADVSQCFLCHQTNSWNDIKGVGWYKHH
jgi:hypothetical protein